MEERGRGGGAVLCLVFLGNNLGIVPHSLRNVDKSSNTGHVYDMRQQN